MVFNTGNYISSYLNLNVITSIWTKVIVILSILVVGVNTTSVTFMSFAFKPHHRISLIHNAEADTTIFYFRFTD